MEDIILAINAIIFSVIAFTPYYSKRDILFGYRVGIELGKHNEAKILRKSYAILNLVIMAIITVLVWLTPLNVEVGTFLQILFVILTAWIVYYFHRQRAKLFLKTHQSEINYSTKVVVSTVNRKMKDISPYWFAINLVFIVASFILGVVLYDKLPNQLPVKYDLAGNIVGYQQKNFLTVFMLPIINTLVTGLLVYVFMVINRAKEELSGKDLKAAQIRSFRFKKFIAVMVIYLSVLINVSMFFLHIQMFQIIKFSNISLIMVLLLPILILLPIIVFMFIGQSGHLLKMNEEEREEEELVRADDKYWKIGWFYYNPKDPSLWIEKRFGLGWTLNFARSGAWIFMTVIILFVIITFIFSI